MMLRLVIRLVSLTFMISQACSAPAAAQLDGVRLATEYRVYPDIIYSTADGHDSRLDVIAPIDLSANGEAETRPVVLYFHGGGWIGGSKERAILRLLPYLQMGFHAVSVEYRLGDVSLAPAAVEDTRCALRWVYQNAAHYRFDTDRIVLTGHSAGGHLSLITAMLNADDGLDYHCAGNAGHSPDLSQIPVAAVVNWFGISDVNDLLEGENAKWYAVRWLGAQPDREAIAARVSPINHVHSDTPPILTIHGTADDIVPYAHASRLHDRLEEQGRPHRLFTIEGGGHGHFTREENEAAHAAIQAFLRNHYVID